MPQHSVQQQLSSLPAEFHHQQQQQEQNSMNDFNVSAFLGLSLFFFFEFFVSQNMEKCEYLYMFLHLHMCNPFVFVGTVPDYGAEYPDSYIF
jgi:hypothetical protein